MIRKVIDRIKMEQVVAFHSTLFSLLALKKGARATHTYGVGGVGRLELNETLPIPQHDFFRPGRSFKVILRHANLGVEDDLAADFKGTALKIHDDHGREVLDIIMNTGARTIWAHAAMFTEQILYQFSGQTKQYFRKYPVALGPYLAGTKRAPDSYTQLAYYSKTPFRFEAKNKELHCIKYRLIAADYSGSDSGSLTYADKEAAIARARMDDDQRPKDFLRQQYNHLLAQRAIEYKLQVKVQPYVADFQHPIYNAMEEWDEQQFPWQDLGSIELSQPLTEARMRQLQFDVGRQPTSLGVIPAKSIYDFTSISYLRSKVYPRAYFTRRFVAALPQRKQLLKTMEQKLSQGGALVKKAL